MRFRRKVDKLLEDYGECDYESKTIRVNPKHGDLLNTIIHEELHRIYPDKTERWVRDEAKRREEKLTICKAIRLLKRYKGRHNGRK